MPSAGLHEVHSLAPSFSLGWRVAMQTSDGVRTERTAAQKLERMAAAIKKGSMSIEDTLTEALSDPAMVSMMSSLLGSEGLAGSLRADTPALAGGNAGPGCGLCPAGQPSSSVR